MTWRLGWRHPASPCSAQRPWAHPRRCAHSRAARPGCCSPWRPPADRVASRRWPKRCGVPNGPRATGPPSTCTSARFGGRWTSSAMVPASSARTRGTRWRRGTASSTPAWWSTSSMVPERGWPRIPRAHDGTWKPLWACGAARPTPSTTRSSSRPRPTTWRRCVATRRSSGWSCFSSLAMPAPPWRRRCRPLTSSRCGNTGGASCSGPGTSPVVRPRRWPPTRTPVTR